MSQSEFHRKIDEAKKEMLEHYEKQYYRYHCHETVFAVRDAIEDFADEMKSLEI